MSGKRIKHIVIFTLKYDMDLEESQAFLRDSEAALTAIPYVERFEVFRQVSNKTDYDFGFSMEFADLAAYEAYSSHPDHVAYVKNLWNEEVLRFLEIDFETTA
ncbi:Dabb family protein [Paenibacillus xerothermodurans]|uniref:Dabb family protein n=1 Tax=Paenibacillus xerothermodurans TaxID=1977292 RepID=A0A2W1P3S1_PAEXE|nr:Dabb family protein [Paenibacillus xerothermodurans]PZE22362.1 Dabb family protein [Paenibacillus xerothermodurans]